MIFFSLDLPEHTFLDGSGIYEQDDHVISGVDWAARDGSDSQSDAIILIIEWNTHLLRAKYFVKLPGPPPH
jgi:hypothetical protein